MTTAFIGLDYIVDITHPSGRMAAAAQQVIDRDVIAKANHALATARRKGWLSVLVKVGFDKGYPNLPRHSRLFGKAKEMGVLEIGSPGTEFHPVLESALADMVLVKPRVNAFHGTGLEPALRARGVTRVVLAGVSTAMAIQSAARDAHDRDFEVLILEEACAAATLADHVDSIRLLGSIADVVTLEQLAQLD